MPDKSLARLMRETPRKEKEPGNRTANNFYKNSENCLVVRLNSGLSRAGECLRHAGARVASQITATLVGTKFLPPKNQRLKNLDTGLSVIRRVARGVERTYRVDTDTVGITRLKSSPHWFLRLMTILQRMG